MADYTNKSFWNFNLANESDDERMNLSPCPDEKSDAEVLEDVADYTHKSFWAFNLANESDEKMDVDSEIKTQGPHPVEESSSWRATVHELERAKIARDVWNNLQSEQRAENSIESFLSLRKSNEKELLPLVPRRKEWPVAVQKLYDELLTIHKKNLADAPDLDLTKETGPKSKSKPYHYTEMLAFMPDKKGQTLAEFYKANKNRPSQLFDFYDTSAINGPCKMFHKDRMEHTSEMVELVKSGMSVYVKRYKFADGSTNKNKEKALRRQRIGMISASCRSVFQLPTDKIQLLPCNKRIITKTGWTGEITCKEFNIAFKAAIRNRPVFSLKDLEEWEQWTFKRYKKKYVSKNNQIRSVSSLQGKWTPELDQRLTKLVEKHGRKWKMIAEKMTEKNRTQCRQRWDLQLDPNISRKPWTAEEEQIIQKSRKDGLGYAAIAKLLPGRTYRMCQARFTSLIRAQLNIREESKEEMIDQDSETKTKGLCPDEETEKWKSNEFEKIKKMKNTENKRDHEQRAENSIESFLSLRKSNEKELLPLVPKGEEWPVAVQKLYDELLTIHKKNLADAPDLDLTTETGPKSKSKPYHYTLMLAFNPDKEGQTLAEFYNANKNRPTPMFDFYDTSHLKGPCGKFHKNSVEKKSEMVELVKSGMSVYVKRYKFADGSTNKNKADALRRQRMGQISASIRSAFQLPTDKIQLLPCNKRIITKTGWTGEITCKEFNIAFKAAIRNRPVFSLKDLEEWEQWVFNGYMEQTAVRKVSSRLWTLEEDQKLKKLVEKYGRQWTKIAEKMTGKNSTQCMQRWDLRLDPNINRKPWTSQEDEILQNGRSKGLGDATIAKLLPGRTNRQVVSRIKSLVVRRLKELENAERED